VRQDEKKTGPLRGRVAVLCLPLLGLRPAPCKGSSGGTVLAFEVYVLGVPVSTGTTFFTHSELFGHRTVWP